MSSTAPRVVSTTIDFDDAIIDIQDYKIYQSSTLTVLRVGLDNVRDEGTSAVNVKILLQAFSASPDADDYLANHATEWQNLKTDEMEAAYMFTTANLKLGAWESRVISFAKGASPAPLVIYAPENAATISRQSNDQQSLFPETVYTIKGNFGL